MAVVAQAPIAEILIAAEIVLGANLRRRKGRARDVVRARWVVMWIARQQEHSYSAIARALGISDHAAVIHACRRVAASLDEYADDIARVETQLRDPRQRKLESLEQRVAQIARELQALKESKHES